ncbi:MAG TPA: alkaline phosphatase family protein, partial [Acidimicrobiales bacterium]|nr:alkaline phosphatase family protein [Acidimicrobiales bacterium]
MDDTTHIKDWHFSRRIFLKGGVLAALSGAAYEGLSNWSSQVSIAGANTPNPVHGRLRSDTAAPGQMNPTGAPGLGPGGKLLLPGSRPFPNVPAGEDMIPQIDHIVVLMMENHSFDDHLGMLGRGDGLTLGPDKLPINYNPNPKGGFIRSFRMPSTFMPQSDGVTQSWTASHKSWDNGTNAGFVAACSPVAMGYWTGEDIPFYYGLAGTFPIGDRYFCSVMAQTYPNRRFLIAATALGNIDTDLSGVAFTGFPNGSIFDTLDSYQISWKDYAYDLPTCALDFPVFQRAQKNGQISTIEQFVVDCSRGTLPSFCIVDPSSQFEGSE